MLHNQQTIKNASNFLKVLGNYYRLQIVDLLISGEKNVTEINEHVSVSQPALSQHLSKLRRAGIVSFRRDRRQIYYTINDPSVLSLLKVMVDFVPQSAPTRDKLQA
ncbi:MAG: winged helix-turn-helix transcriptional regulator [Alphaproteobacteria bacterium]|nr:winged helix-turn-helix transcriptional regulator [Alphaproteobacteria bacterium]